MNIDEIKAKKTEAENMILSILVQFANDTGLVVTDIELDVQRISSMGVGDKMICTNVTLDVRLPA